MIVVRVSADEEVVMEARPALKSLVVLKGSVPPGWKQAAYGEHDE